MICWDKIIELDRKKRSLMPSFALDVTHKKICLRFAPASSHLHLFNVAEDECFLQVQCRQPCNSTNAFAPEIIRD